MDAQPADGGEVGAEEEVAEEGGGDLVGRADEGVGRAARDLVRVRVRGRVRQE